MRNIREAAFWALDGVRGGPVKKKYELFREMERQNDPNTEALTAILAYARKQVPFYRDIASDLLAAFPVVDKTRIKSSYADFRSLEFQDDSVLTVYHTSGSSGTPFKAFRDPEKEACHKASLILQDEEIGWIVGDRWAHLRNWGFGAPASAKERFVKNMVPLSILNLDDAKLEHIVQTLHRDRKLQIILGYASGLERVAQYIVQHQYEALDFGIRLIIADSDNLKESTWDLLEQIFKCPVLNRYANIENGIIATTKPGDRTFYTNQSQVYVEVLKPDVDVSVCEGETGRIVITDLHNKALPFIRYDTGDLAVAKKIVGGQCLELASLQGRAISALRRVDGTLLSETNIMGRFKEFTEIGRYQIIQRTESEYEMLLEDTPERVDARCAAALKKIFGEDAHVTITHLEQIPLKKSGKCPVTVSEL